jgi:endonuclease/exonuclease/phosphatase family metal-dependent hydrolase
MLRIPLILLALVIQVAAQEIAPIVFCSYNLENYSAGKPPGPGAKFGTRPKSDESIAALVSMVKQVKPDVLGVCEMGSPEMLADLQRRLAEAGVNLPESEFVAAADEDRHLALLSRFPIAGRRSATDVRFILNGQEERVRRGILDVTVQVAPDYALRCVGVHLKSKMPIPEGEAIIRRMEAKKLREHLDGIFRDDPSVNLICYGDFNDTKNEPMFQEVSGPRSAPGHLLDLWCEDPLGDRWTHYWKTADLYSRIDYLFVSTGLMPEVDKSRSTVHRAPNWNDASDHRPISAVIRPVNVTRR